MALTNLNPISRQKYIIPTSLTHSSGIITAVVNGASYQVTLSGLTYVTRYFLYLNNGSLVYVTTLPSTYRATNPNAILVGAFYSNGLASVAFGAFVNIEGVPNTSAAIPYVLSIVDQNNVNVMSAQELGSGVRRDAYFDIRGGMAAMHGGYYHTTTPGSTGTSSYVIKAPTTFTVQNAPAAGLPFSGGNSGTGGGGAFQGDVGGGQFAMGVHYPSLGSPLNGIGFRLQVGGTTGFLGASLYQLSQNFVGFGWSNCLIHVSELTETSLKDL